MARDPWTDWHLHDEVSNGTERGVIVRADFGARLPMVRIAEGPRARALVWPWESPRWRALTEAQSEAAHRLSEDERRAADYAADTGDNRRTRDGRVTLPTFSPELRAFMRRNREAAMATPVPPRDEDDECPF